MKKKENKGTGSHGIGNRTVIGIICIVSALLICFGVAPVVNRISDGKVAIVRVIRQVEAGAVIGADDVAVVEVGRHNLPEGIVTKTEDVIGKCAKSDLYAGDYILKDKLTGTEKTAKDLLGNLGSGKKAISVTIPSFGNGFSGKLRTGDIVSIIVYDNTENRAFTAKGAAVCQGHYDHDLAGCGSRGCGGRHTARHHHLPCECGTGGASLALR